MALHGHTPAQRARKKAARKKTAHKKPVKRRKR
jgi:hypothetical protein